MKTIKCKYARMCSTKSNALHGTQINLPRNNSPLAYVGDPISQPQVVNTIVKNAIRGFLKIFEIFKMMAIFVPRITKITNVRTKVAATPKKLKTLKIPCNNTLLGTPHQAPAAKKSSHQHAPAKSHFEKKK